MSSSGGAYPRGPAAITGPRKPIEHPLLQDERANSSARPLQLAYLLYGGKRAFTRMRRLQALMEADPIFDRTDRPFQNHTERYYRSAEKMARFHSRCRELGITDPREIRWAYTAIDEVLPTDVHMAMVIPALEYQTSPEQRDRWLPLAKEFKILGAYVQTELGHGSNVRGIETTATYDPASEEFVLHSPTLTSTKWWPGGLGKTATHAILMARLVTGNKDRGVQPFFIRLRDAEEHMPLPGITIGDIGPKLGFNSTDNGFARFNQVRVPRDSMLMGVAEVLPDGSYRRVPGGDKKAYGAMLDVRANLVARASMSLGRALTIAMRFCAVRQQGFIDEDAAAFASRRQPPLERAVIEYTTVQRALMPLLSFAFALHFTGEHMREQYESYLKTLDTSLLPAVHATSSGLKALITQTVADGIESCRKMCGGHGYSSFSGLPELSNNYLALATLEGTQQVLEPQMARFLLRALRSARAGKPVPATFEYLQEEGQLLGSSGSGAAACEIPATTRDMLSPAWQLRIFRRRALVALRQAEEAWASAAGSSGVGNGCGNGGGKEGDEKRAMLGCAVELGRASRAHCELHILERFSEAITAMERAICGGGEADETAAETGETTSSSAGSAAAAAAAAARSAATPAAAAVAAAAATAAGLNSREIKVLRRLVDLFALSSIEQNLGDFVEKGSLVGPAGPARIRAAVAAACGDVRQEAVSLCDAWHFTDKYLGSAIGRYDGDVYTALMEAALREPLNAREVADSVVSVRRLVGVPPSPRL